ncbi:hypothetical protein SDC9_166240 [bioreactor metagenome]|uniref:Uncharacterized protein n=1 Tax=bioreactor metagenome TaxID=1076179 RepID=A0A645FWQ0_9ZZZZ
MLLQGIKSCRHILGTAFAQIVRVQALNTLRKRLKFFWQDSKARTWTARIIQRGGNGTVERIDPQSHGRALHLGSVLLVLIQ